MSEEPKRLTRRELTSALAARQAAYVERLNTYLRESFNNRAMSRDGVLGEVDPGTLTALIKELAPRIGTVALDAALDTVFGPQ